MRYSFNGSSFLDRSIDAEDTEDPMASLANMVDVMLVLACGLMMALVVFWKLDLPSITELDSTEMQEVEDVEEMVEEIQSTTNPYMELGKVYQDPTTGKLYMLTETTEEAAESAGGVQGYTASSSNEAAEQRESADTSSNGQGEGTQASPAATPQTTSE